jgi:hypothetical protein
MKEMLSPLRLNELLDFVRRCRSSLLEPSPLILSSNSPIAAWRFISHHHQLSTLARAQSIQATLAFNCSCAFQDARQLVQAFEL